MKTIQFLIIIIILSTFTSMNAQNNSDKNKKVVKTEDEWKEILTEQQYYVLREKGTDRPGNYGYTKHFEKGTYHCAACDAKLFASNSKYESHCGWPSFDDALEGAIIFNRDVSHGMIRTEIVCSTCDGHLGHIFDDGPKETTGKRYCVNTSSIKFKKGE